MCILCGELITSLHWSEGVADDSSEIIVGSNQHARLKSRLNKAKKINLILSFYGLTFSEWGNSKYIVADKKGKSAIVDNLGSVWIKAQEILGKEIDPLDSALLAFVKHG